MDFRIEKLAKNLVNYSMAVRPGDKVYVHYIGKTTKALARQIIKEVYKAGGVPFPHYTDNQVLRETLLGCTKEQLELMAKIDGEEMDAMDCYVAVRGADNVAELADVPAEKMKLYDLYYIDEGFVMPREHQCNWLGYSRGQFICLIQNCKSKK